MLVYGKIREALGVRRAVISGGGSLAPHLDLFYETIGLTVLNGWGLSVRCYRNPPTPPCYTLDLLAPHLDHFYETIGLTVLDGWRLSVRMSDNHPYAEMSETWKFSRSTRTSSTA